MRSEGTAPNSDDASAMEFGMRRRGKNEVIELGRPKVVAAGPTPFSLASKALVFFVLVSISILFGAIQTWVWSLYTMVIFLAFVLFAWHQCFAGGAVGMNGYGAAVGMFFALTLLACLPMPENVIALLNPVRHRLLQQTEALTHLDAVWPTLSYAPFHSLGWWSFLLSLVLFFLLLKNQFSSRSMLEWVCRIFLILAVAQALYGILQALVPNMGVLWVNNMNSYVGNARGTWINRNHFAGFMVMMLPLLMGYTLSRVRWRRKFHIKVLLHSDRIHQHSLLLLALAVIALALLFSKSRAGIISAIFGVGTFFLLIRGQDRRISKRFWIIAGGFSGMTLLYGLRIGFRPIIDRFLMLDQGSTRLEFWKDSLPIIIEHPFGIGLATFKYVFPVYNVSSLSDTVTPHYLHNDILQLLVETGFLGFTLLMGAYVVFLVQSFRRIRQMDLSADPWRYFLAAGAFSGLMGISFHSFFDFNLQVPANALYFVVLLALVKVCAKSIPLQRMD